MNAVSARVAGVGRIAMCVPAPGGVLNRVSAAAWRAWVHAASTRGRVVMLMRVGSCDCAALRTAVGRALAVSADWHGGGAGQLIRSAGIRERLAASESYGGDERGG